MSVRDQIIVLQCAQRRSLSLTPCVSYASKTSLRPFLAIHRPRAGREGERERERWKTIGNHPRRPGGRSIVLVVSGILMFVRQDREEKKPRVSSWLRGTHRRERERARRSVYMRWLSTPVIKYGASKGSQHARASTFKNGARTFSLSHGSSCLLYRPLKHVRDQSSEFIYLIVIAVI